MADKQFAVTNRRTIEDTYLVTAKSTHDAAAKVAIAMSKSVEPDTSVETKAELLRPQISTTEASATAAPATPATTDGDE